MAKKILVVGGGGREHAIIKALKKSPDCGEIWCAPGNGGISYDAKCKNIKATDVETWWPLPLRKSLIMWSWRRMTRWRWAWWTHWLQWASLPLAQTRPLPASRPPRCSLRT